MDFYLRIIEIAEVKRFAILRFEMFYKCTGIRSLITSIVIIAIFAIFRVYEFHYCATNLLSRVCSFENFLSEMSCKI